MSLEKEWEVIPGQPAPTMLDLLKTDTRALREILLENYNDYLDDKVHVIDKERYLSPEIYQREIDLVWTKTWQMACREEQIPEVGDFLIYEICDKQVIVVRSAPDEIGAFFNACPHRSRMICNEGGHAAHFRCPFHGLSWKLDGTLLNVPFRWDFPGVKDEDVGMFKVKSARWQGSVFINMDPDSIPFEDYIAGLPAHAEPWDYENRYIAMHVGQVIRANWKVTLEAFLEDFHIMATHPQALPFIPWGAAQYNARKDQPHWSRLLFGNGHPSFMVADPSDEQKTLEAVKGQYGVMPGEEADWVVPEGLTARQHMAEIMRKRATQAANGKDFSQVSDSEMVDNWVYYIFPNVFLWGGYSNLFYRWRPWTNDPELSMMEIFFLAPLPEGLPRPAPAKMTLLGADQKFSDAPELAGATGEFFDQDLTNIEWVQRGLKTNPGEGIMPSNYNESQIRHFHRTLDMYLAGKPPVG